MKIKDHFLTQETFEIKETATSGVFKTFPIPQDLDKYYDTPDYISHHQDTGSSKERLYKLLQKYNLQYKKSILDSSLKPNATVLDYGCGAGEFLKFIEADYNTIGFEPNSVARKFASEKAKKTQFTSNIESIADGSLDAITLWHVFEHIENQQETLQIFKNKLKEKGLLIIAVPNSSSFDANYYKEFWAAYDVPRHIFHFTKSGMEKLMNTEIWKIKKIKPLILDSFYISMLSEKYKNSGLIWLKGLFYGAISNLKALKSGEFSSLIYIIEKK
ncbi:MAG: class I SAM-dependent methyltransferase [Kaistella sp.]